MVWIAIVDCFSLYCVIVFSSFLREVLLRTFAVGLFLFGDERFILLCALICVSSSIASFRYYTRRHCSWYIIFFCFFAFVSPCDSGWLL